MGPVWELLGVYWLPGLIFAAGLAGIGYWLRCRSDGVPAWKALVLGSAGLAFGLGGLTLGHIRMESGQGPYEIDLGFWIAVVAGGLLLVKLVVLVITGHWYTPVGAIPAPWCSSASAAG